MFSNIIVGADGNSGERDAAALAAKIGGPTARLTLVHVERTDPGPTRASDQGSQPSEAVCVTASSVGAGLERCAADRGADLIVVGACERGAIGRVLIGDDAASVLHQAQRPVAIAPRGYASRDHTLSTVGVAYDGSAESEMARGWAEDLARGLGAELVAQCVVPPHFYATGVGAGAGYMEDPEDLVARTRAALGDLADGVKIVVGLVDPELLTFSHEVDLLVCGSRHNQLLRRVTMGSTSGYLAHHAACPLIVAAMPGAPGSHPTGRSATATA